MTFLPLTTPALASIHPALLGGRPHQLHRAIVPPHHVRRVPARHDHRVELPGGHGVGLGTSTVTG